MLEQKVRVLEETVKIQREQITSLMTQQSVLIKDYTQQTSELIKRLPPNPATTGSNAFTVLPDHSSKTPFIQEGEQYIRWGRTTCAGDATVLYKGYTAGSYFNEGAGGGGVSYLCLPETPQWGNQTNSGFQGGSKLFGTEYEFAGSPFSTSNNGGQSLYQNNAPCVSCYSPTRSTVTMIPARIDCPIGWTREYGGFLVSSHPSHNTGKTFECLDAAPEVVTGGATDTNGALFYFVEASCGALPCPRYAEGWEIACVVCSK
jgi:hypothetical protein